MKCYYRAYNVQGVALTGTIECNNERDAIDKLGAQDLMVVELKQVSDKYQVERRRKTKASLPALTIFTRQLTTMLRAGLPLLKCLQTLQGQVRDRGMMQILPELERAIENGVSFGQALRQFPLTFSRVYVGLVEAGESSGTLPDSLDRMALYLESTLRLRQRVRSAMMYPVLVAVMGLGVSVFMITTIIPVFVDIYKEFDRDLPLPTQILINTSTWIRSHLLMTFAVAIALVLVLRWVRRTPAGAKLWDGLKLRVPIFGPLSLKIALSRFSRTFAVLSHSGLAVLRCLDIAARTVDNVPMEMALARVGMLVESGATMYEAMRHTKMFPPMVLDMVAAGEKTGQVGQMLNHVADHYDREIDGTLSNLTTVLEPLLILFLGVVVGSVVVAMFLPIFRMAEAVQF